MDHIAFGIVMAVKHYKNVRSGKGGAVVNLSIDLLWSNLKPATEVVGATTRNHSTLFINIIGS
jgi:hypothetical protein